MAKKILIIGGTRNIGYFLAQRLSQTDHQLTLLNRGITPDDLPEAIYRLRCDRTDPDQMRRALAGRSFDTVIDTAVYRGEEARTVVDLLRGSVGQYIALSSGQVYLVREGVERPYSEEDYDGPVMASPTPNTYDYEEWLYGTGKREVEDTVFGADDFPATTLRLPMVNSERDGFHRLYGYLLRIDDGGPILVPDAPDYALRHVYSGDVVAALMHLIETGDGVGRAYNISQDETVSLHEFLTMLGEVMGKQPEIRTMERDLLDANGLLPDCSPFSDLWMSELDNTRSKTELGLSYTPLREYLQAIVAHHRDNPQPQPVGYHRRRTERQIASMHPAR